MGGGLLEGQPFAADPQVAPFLFASFTDFLAQRQRQHVEAVRRRVHGGLWEALGGMALEGVGLAKRLQGPSATVGGPSAEASSARAAPATGSDGAAAAAAQQQLLLGPVLLKVMCLLPTSVEVGGGAWAEAWRSETAVGTSGGAPGGPSQAPPVSLEQLAAWVEGQGTGLRALAAQCTPEGAAARLGSTPWGAEYTRKDSCALGDDLRSHDLCETHLPDYLLAPLMERWVRWVGHSGRRESHGALPVVLYVGFQRSPTGTAARVVLSP